MVPEISKPREQRGERGRRVRRSEGGRALVGLSVVAGIAAVWVVSAGAGSAHVTRPATMESTTTAPEVVDRFEKAVRPILVAKCFACHGDGGDSGGIAFDALETAGKLKGDTSVWMRVLKNIRAGLMPPKGEEKLTADERTALETWIKGGVFQIDPAHPDPGRVTLRRLNRVEYRNTIRDLTGVDYRTDEEFPADDTGHGFDNMADVLTLSPMQLEKYIAAANTVVTGFVPTTGRVPAERYIAGNRFVDDPAKNKGGDGQLDVSLYEPTTRKTKLELRAGGTYRVVFEAMVTARHIEKGFDTNKAVISLAIDGKEVQKKESGWQEKMSFWHTEEIKLAGGSHELALTVTPTGEKGEKTGETRVKLSNVRVIGPMAPEEWVKAPGHEKVFGKEAIPPAADKAGRLARAKQILGEFASRAYRRPVDEATAGRLAAFAMGVSERDGVEFEAGVAQAMVAVLASPRFLFREDTVLAAAGGERYPLIDEYSLASRLSYFLWSSGPDGELLKLAGAGELRKNLPAQVKRMMADGKARALTDNFVGQWLQTRDVQTSLVDRKKVVNDKDLAALNLEDDGEYNEVRRFMRQETERYFAYVAKENRSLLEFVDSNYTFLNERLAQHYGVSDVKGKEMRRVTLPADSVRGGLITMGSTLMVTSNPTRTSPVKRGLFLLENVLGSPPPPPPPNIPSLEEASKGHKGKALPLRKTLEMHRAAADCMSCHTRLDPPGLALENFTAIGTWRDMDQGEKIDSTGTLVTGEPFKDIRELKATLVKNHHEEIYRCLTEKFLTYALGRGLESYDVATVDAIVAKLEADGGRFDSLLMGVIDAAPFQRRRAEGSEGKAVAQGDRR